MLDKIFNSDNGLDMPLEFVECDEVGQRAMQTPSMAVVHLTRGRQWITTRSLNDL